MKYNWFYILVCSALLFTVGPNLSASAQSDRIVFREQLNAVHDSIAVLNQLMNKMVDADEKNYFFDKHDWLFINNRKVGRMTNDKSINFLGLMAVQTDLSQKECRKFLALSMFLKRNFMSACIRHDRYGVYFYIYQPPGRKGNDDFRYIVLYDERLIKMTGTDEAESFTVLDRQNNMLLLLPAGKNK